MEKEKNTKKKVVLITLAVVVVAVLLVCLVRCQPNGSTDPVGNGTTGTIENTGEAITESAENSEPTQPGEDTSEPTTEATGSASESTESPVDTTEPSTENTEPPEDTTDPTGELTTETTQDVEKPTEPPEPTQSTTKPTEPSKPTQPATEPTEPSRPTQPETKPTEPTDKPTEPEETIFGHNHLFAYEVTKEATCTSEGVMTYTCSCGDSYTEKIAKVAHKYTDSVVKPTCVKDGYTTHTCSVCGTSYTDGKKPATGHAYTSKVTTSPTCSKDGVKTYTCSACSHSYTEAVPASGHSWKHTHTDEVGHKEVYIVCHCGWSFPVSKAEALGYEDWEYFHEFHVKQFELADQRGHTYYDESRWVVDTPAQDYYTCTECGAKK